MAAVLDSLAAPRAAVSAGCAAPVRYTMNSMGPSGLRIGLRSDGSLRKLALPSSPAALIGRPSRAGRRGVVREAKNTAAQGHGLPYGKCFPCSVVLGGTYFSWYPGISNTKCCSQLNGVCARNAVDYWSTKMTIFTCAAGSPGHRRNPDFSRQGKAGKGFSRSKNRQDNNSDNNPDESELLSSRNGPLLSLSGNPRGQATASPGPREKEIVQLFRKVQAQLRERAAIKEEKKIESAQSHGERGTVDSLLKLLRKHSVQQGTQKDVNEDLNPHQSEQKTPNDEEHNRNFFDTASISREKVPKRASSTRPASNFRRKSPVPRVKFQPIHSAADFTAPASFVERKEKREDNGFSNVRTDKLEMDENDETKDLEFELEEMHSEVSDVDVDEAEEGRTENGASFSPLTTGLSALKLSELRAIAKSKGVKGYSRLKKVELVELLSEVED